MEYYFIIIFAALSVVSITLLIILAFHFSMIIKRTQNSFNLVLDLAADYRISWSSDLSEVEYDKKTREMIEQSGHKADKHYLQIIFGENSALVASAEIGILVKAINPEGVTTKFVLDDRSTRVIHWKSRVVRLKGDRSYVETIGSDITENVVNRRIVDEFRIAMERESSERLEILSNSTASTIIFYNEFSNTFVKFTDEYTDLLGFEGNKRITLEELFSHVINNERSEFIKAVSSFLSGLNECLDVIVTLKDKNGFYSPFVVRCGKSERLINELPSMTGIISRASSKALRRKKDEIALIDTTTELLNRKSFMEQGTELLNKYKENETPCVMVCIQIQRLQKISTLFGIEITDTLQRLYADALRKFAKEGALIGKVGIEDFAVLFETGERGDVTRLLKDIAILIENSCDNHILPSILKEQVKFDAGACFYDGFDDITTLYNKASVTLYTGSQLKGELCSFFNNAVEQRVCERDMLEHEIGDAFERGRLELYYQPKIDFNTEKIIGAEALMRWNHETRGLVMPGEFIQIAEEIGLITRIDEWGLLQACRQNKIWAERGFAPIKISVNMSQAQLYQTDLVSTVKNALQKSEMDPKYLEIEITETMAMLDIERSISVLKHVRELGVTIAMDDFGTGYSSLSSLKLLPIDVLKIDKSLVDDIETNETSRHIATAIVNLGKAMNLTILAEGVETEGQRDILRTLGCDIAQGYLYSKPLPSALLERKFLVEK